MVEGAWDFLKYIFRFFFNINFTFVTQIATEVIIFWKYLVKSQ